MKRTRVEGTLVHYDPSNITEEQAIEQAAVAQARCDLMGHHLQSFAASAAHKGEPWYEKLRGLRAKMTDRRVM